MKKIITTSFVLASILYASPFSDNVQYLNQKIDLLQKEVKILKKQNEKIKELEAKINALTKNAKKSKPTAVNTKNNNNSLKKEIDSLKAQVNDNADYIEEVDDNVGNLTAKVLKNSKVGFTRLKFDNTLHNFFYRTADGKNHNNKNVDTLNLKMDLEAIISPKLTFRGQLAMYKYWSQSTPYPYASYDNMQGRVPSNSGIYVTRAYIDWKAIDGKIPTTLTIGRQPSSSGPSWQYSNNGVRYGTYDALVFDGNADGVVATMNLDKVTPLKNSAFRLAYGKGFQNSNIKAENGLTDTPVYGIFLESQIPAVNNSFMQMYYATARNINTNTASIGNIDWFGGMFELNNISNFDFFAHFSVSKARPNGNIGEIDSQHHTAGLLTNTKGDVETKTGNAYWLGARYTFKSKAKLGLEYSHGSKNWINMTQGSDNILNPRSVRGNVWDIYGIYPIDNTIGVNAFVKLGATLIDYKYTNSGTPFGKPQKISSDMQNADKTIDKLNDYYLDFQVNY
jgi:uncharacterized protein YnzC (UPF0291/DUF896 family)